VLESGLTQLDAMQILLLRSARGTLSASPSR